MLVRNPASICPLSNFVRFVVMVFIVGMDGGAATAAGATGGVATVAGVGVVS